jgi:hypothetical protein
LLSVNSVTIVDRNQALLVYLSAGIFLTLATGKIVRQLILALAPITTAKMPSTNRRA